MRHRVLPALLLGGLVAALLPWAVPNVAAAPLPATYSGDTDGDLLDLNMVVLGSPVVTTVGHSATAVDSTGAPRAHAESANLEESLGEISVAGDEANSDNVTPTDSYDADLGQVDVPPWINTDLISGAGTTNWAGDLDCVADGTAIAASSTQLAGGTLAVPGVQLASFSTISTSGSTTLDQGSVVATSGGQVASFTMVNGLVGISVPTAPTLTATSDGTTGSVAVNEYAVDVTYAGTTTTLTAGESTVVNASIPLIADVSLTLTVGTLDDTSSGATGSGALSLLSITGNVTNFAAPVASVDVDLLPLSATATAPTGGVECDPVMPTTTMALLPSPTSTTTTTTMPAPAIEPPVVTGPDDGDTIDDPTPWISGTGEPGATIDVYVDDELVATTSVDREGDWAATPAHPLVCGDHVIRATQSIDGLTSEWAAPVTITRECRRLPATGFSDTLRLLAIAGAALAALGLGALQLRRRITP